MARRRLNGSNSSSNMVRLRLNSSNISSNMARLRLNSSNTSSNMVPLNSINSINNMLARLINILARRNFAIIMFTIRRSININNSNSNMAVSRNLCSSSRRRRSLACRQLPL